MKKIIISDKGYELLLDIVNNYLKSLSRDIVNESKKLPSVVEDPDNPTRKILQETLNTYVALQDDIARNVKDCDINELL